MGCLLIVVILAALITLGLSVNGINYVLSYPNEFRISIAVLFIAIISLLLARKYVSRKILLLVTFCVIGVFNIENYRFANKEYPIEFILGSTEDIEVQITNRGDETKKSSVGNPASFTLKKGLYEYKAWFKGYEYGSDTGYFSIPSEVRITVDPKKEVYKPPVDDGCGYKVVTVECMEKFFRKYQ